MSIRTLVGLWFCVALASPAVARANASFPVTKTVLPNGLIVLVLEDHATPCVAVHTVFKVGSRNEHNGITGLSHLFEHMMFNGSAKYAPKQFDRLIEAGGGYSNAFTTSDSTQYHEEFASPTLDTVLRLESDRLRALRLDKANVEQERGIVKEERRSGTDDSVEGSMNELLYNQAFVAHPYRGSIIGFMKDLDAITLADAKRYFATYYTPSNAVLAVVGDVDTADVLARVRRYYGDIPRGPARPPVINSEPTQSGVRRAVLSRPAMLPAVQMGYKVGPYTHPDDPALDILSTILGAGESARLHRDLVYRQQVATGIAAYNDSRLDLGLFVLYAQAQQGKTAAECEAALKKSIAEIAEHGPTERELGRARNMNRVGFIGRLKTNAGRASLVAEFEAMRGGWRKAFDVLARYDKVTAADVQRVARKYLSDRTCTVVTLDPIAVSEGTR